MRIGIFSGSFDPLTHGHLWLINESIRLFDEYHVVIGPNPNKSYTFSLEERESLLKSVIKPPIKTHAIRKGYILNYVDELNGDVFLIRGVRDEKDYAYESKILKEFRAVGCKIPYLLFKAEQDISSSYIKELSKLGKWEEVKKLVPDVVYDKLIKRFL
jgi:pantetheine-phosphate adenylyltransferase